MIKRFIVEFIGTFFLSLVVCMCSFSSLQGVSSLAPGLILIGLIYASGHNSGAHFNPAVSIAVFLRGKMGLNAVPLYILAQSLGGILAALITVLLTTNKSVPVLQLSSITLESMLAEFLGTFAIAYVILNVATSKNTQGNDYYGFAIGLAVVGCSFAFTGISGAAMNPAVALAMCFSKLSAFSNLWIYWIGEILGGVLASVVYLFLNGKE